MNKHAIIFGFLATLIVAGVWFLVFHDQAVAPSQHDIARPGSSRSVERNQSAIVSETFAGTGSFEDLVGLGRDLTCDFSSVSATTNATTAGTVQVSGPLIRSDFQAQHDGEIYEAHLIQNDRYAYSWIGSEAGIVALRTPLGDTRAGDRSVLADSDVDYHCKAWDADVSVFVPPDNLTFIESEAFIPSFDAISAVR